MLVGMVAWVPSDYDADPGRSRAADCSWQRHGDVHEPVAARLAATNAVPVIDVGGGRGRFAELLPGTVVIDRSRTQLVEAPYPKVLADARVLPLRTDCAASVAMLWMLYHLDDPISALTEAKRVLRPGGVLVVCTSSRTQDPELTDGYPPSPFDAEEAPGIVRGVFGEAEVEFWDGPFTVLPDRDAIERAPPPRSSPAKR